MREYLLEQRKSYQRFFNSEIITEKTFFGLVTVVNKQLLTGDSDTAISGMIRKSLHPGAFVHI